MNIHTNELVAFGKHLLNHLEAPIHPDDVDWEFILRQFGFKQDRTTPGLMFLNWTVCTMMEVDPTDVRYSVTGRNKDERLARQVAFYIATAYYDYGPSEVAEFYLKGGETPINHSTVIHGRKVITKDIQTDYKLKRKIEDIIFKLTGYEYTDKITWEGHNTTGILKDVSEPETK